VKNKDNMKKELLVGDNPFQGVSHLSQQRAMSREGDLSDPKYCADLVVASVDSGADGFMFTVNEKTLAILREIARKKIRKQLRLYPIVPDAPGLARVAGRKGGIIGLGRDLAKGVIMSGGVAGILSANPEALFRGYLGCEASRIEKAMGRGMVLASVLLHEIVTDTALALNLEWLFRVHRDFAKRHGVKAGFETRNFAYLAGKCGKWLFGLNGAVIAAPFNRIGFQMCPSQRGNEETLTEIPMTEVIAFSVLAAGYLKLPEAAKYIGGLPNIAGVAVGVSNERQAKETFQFLVGRLK
jgi:hypothetical protein